MNNCYGKNGNMQKRMVSIMPFVGENVTVSICVPDTTDEEAISTYVERWIKDNVKIGVSSYEISECDTLFFSELIGTQVDKFDNEYDVYCLWPTIRLRDYFRIFEDSFSISWKDLTADCQKRFLEFLKGNKGMYETSPIVTINQ